MDTQISCEQTQQPKQPLKMALAFFVIGFLILTNVFTLFLLQQKQTTTTQQEQGDKKPNGNNEREQQTQKSIQEWEKHTYISDNGISQFTFMSPKGWSISKERGYIISNHPNMCESCSDEEKQNFYAISIVEQPEQENKTKTTSALKYLLQQWLSFIEDDERRCSDQKKNGKPCMPIIPGFTQEIIETDPLIFSNTKKVTAVRVREYFNHTLDGSFVDEYVVVNQRGTVFTVNIVYPKNDLPVTISKNDDEMLNDNHPLVTIIQSFEML